jgi:hypothetical protein
MMKHDEEEKFFSIEKKNSNRKKFQKLPLLEMYQKGHNAFQI